MTIPKKQREDIFKYKQLDDKNKRLISRTFLFQYLQKEFNINNFEFSYTDINRPTIKNIPIDFNLSYSKDLIAIAITNKNRIAIDIEYINQDIDINDLIPICMNDKESNEIKKSIKHKNYHINKFYELWTYKEALAKFIGKGLYLDIKNIVSLEERKLNITTDHIYIDNIYSVSIVVSNE